MITQSLTVLLSALLLCTSCSKKNEKQVRQEKLPIGNMNFSPTPKDLAEIEKQQEIKVKLSNVNKALSKGQNQEADERLYGTWATEKDVAQKLRITFLNKTEYELFTAEQIFNGNYSRSGDTLNLVDVYCGTKLPGKYTYKFNKDRLNFTKLDDNNCNRAYFMHSDTWIRIKK